MKFGLSNMNLGKMQQLTWQICCPSRTVLLASNISLFGKRHIEHKHYDMTIKLHRNLNLCMQWDGCTWEDKDKAGCQSSNQWDDPANIWNEESEDEGDDKPHQRLQDPPPLLSTYTHLYLLTLETQPKALDNCPGRTHDNTRAQWGNALMLNALGL